jgi:protein ImuA
MHKTKSKKSLSHLRALIAGIENRPVLDRPAIISDSEHSERQRPARPARGQKTRTGRPASPPPWQGSLPGLVHEVWGTGARNSGAMLGFALGQAKALLIPAKPLILWLQPVHYTAETGLVYAAGLLAFGLDPKALVIGRMANVRKLLWATEEALGCRAVAAVLADMDGGASGLDFTASRRLTLRAQAAGTSVFLLRYGTGRPASAAFMRWRVDPASSTPHPFDARAAGAPRFGLTLERSKAGIRGNWLVEWQNGEFSEIDRSIESTPVPHTPAAYAPAPLPPAAPGPVVSPLGHRLSQTA